MTGAKHQIAGLTGLRAVAAFAVLFAHKIDWAVPPEAAWAHGFTHRLAYFAMSLFFVLSGFVIQYNYGRRLASGSWRERYNFLVARFARLYPLYAAVMLFGFWSAGSIPYLDRPDIFYSHVFLMQSWFNAVRAYFPPAWSISTEWFFYLAFIPAAGFFFNIRNPMRALVWLSIGSVVGLLIVFSFRSETTYVLATIFKVFIDRGDLSSHPWDWLTYYAPPARILEFFTGVLVARIVISVPDAAGAAAIAWCAGVIALGDAIPEPFAQFLPNYVYAPALAVIVLYVAQPRPHRLGILSTAPFLFAGEISYSIYMLNGAAVGNFGLPGAAGWVGNIIMVVAASVVTYFAIERPARRVLRLAMIRTKPKATPPPKDKTPEQLGASAVAAE